MHGLYELIKRMLEEVDIRVMVRPNTTPRKLLVKSKVPVPVECCVGIVYHIPCKDCSQTYRIAGNFRMVLIFAYYACAFCMRK